MNVTLGVFHTTPEIREAVNRVLDSDRLSYGPVTREFENKFSRLHGVKHGVASNSGTSSLVVAIQAMKELYEWKDGDEIIVPALTFVASINAVLHNRLTPILVDIDPLTYNIDVNKIYEKITEKTVAIMPVHLFGLMANIGMVRECALVYGLKIIEDSCETVLATSYGFHPGQVGDVACFSTYVAHHLVTGVGGMSITNNSDLAWKMRSLVNHGIDLHSLPFGLQYDPTFLSRKFKFTSIGHSFRITEIEAAIGLAQLDSLPEQVYQRQKNAEYLIEKMRCLQERIQLPFVDMGDTHSWMVFPIVLKNGSKWPLMEHLNENGIECREMLPLTNQPCYSGLWDEADYPVAGNINNRGIYLPIHQDLTQKQIDYMVNVVSSYFSQIQETTYDFDSHSREEV